MNSQDTCKVKFGLTHGAHFIGQGPGRGILQIFVEAVACWEMFYGFPYAMDFDRIVPRHPIRKAP